MMILNKITYIMIVPSIKQKISNKMMQSMQNKLKLVDLELTLRGILNVLE